MHLKYFFSIEIGHQIVETMSCPKFIYILDLKEYKDMSCSIYDTEQFFRKTRKSHTYQDHM